MDGEELSFFEYRTWNPMSIPKRSKKKVLGEEVWML